MHELNELVGGFLHGLPGVLLQPCLSKEVLKLLLVELLPGGDQIYELNFSIEVDSACLGQERVVQVAKVPLDVGAPLAVDTVYYLPRMLLAKLDGSPAARRYESASLPCCAASLWPLLVELANCLREDVRAVVRLLLACWRRACRRSLRCRARLASFAWRWRGRRRTPPCIFTPSYCSARFLPTTHLTVLRSGFCHL